MRTLQATTAQIGGMSFHTDNDEHPLLTNINRLVIVWTQVGVELQLLFVLLQVAAKHHTDVCQRLVSVFNWLEDWAGAIGETWQIAQGDWVGYWFRWGWSYGNA